MKKKIGTKEKGNKVVNQVKTVSVPPTHFYYTKNFLNREIKIPIPQVHTTLESAIEFSKALSKEEKSKPFPINILPLNVFAENFALQGDGNRKERRKEEQEIISVGKRLNVKNVFCVMLSGLPQDTSNLIYIN